MRVDTAVGIVAQLAPAIVLLSAALSKVIDLKGFRQTLVRLGIHREELAVAVAGAELGTAVALLVAAAAWWPRALVVVLATGFAAAGLVAIRTRRRIDCRCFGTAGRGTLGWPQVVLWPVWLGVAGVAQWRPPQWSFATGLMLLAGSVLALLALRIPAGVRLVRTLHEDRIAIAPVYTGVRPDDPGALRLDGSGALLEAPR